ncbi:t-SNARE domain-containing protein 1-like [Dendropsophus ebraccatus]|uniref:t-SNARE domain-containing protein 1-like n=1 Tax=Dendropsophus ebraccatus TaxID=150705 RepID=UPI00383192BD
MSLTGKSGSSPKMKTPKKRRERFSDQEVQKLVDTILGHIKQLFGAKSINPAGKAAIWDKVVKEVNKVGGMKRTTAECKKRFLDYKRKVKQSIDGLRLSSLGGERLPLSECLTRRQVMVAEFYKMDTSDGQKSVIPDESSSDKGECVSTNEPFPIDSEDDFIDKSFSSTSSHQDKLISQSQEEPQTPSVSCDPHNTKVVDAPIAPHTATESQLQMDQLVAQQRNICEALESLQKNVTASLNIQNKMYKFMKSSFLGLHKTLLSSQKASSDQGGILELRLSRLTAKLDEMNSALQVKELQEIMSSDESELNASGIRDLSSTPTATYTPATPHSKNTPARKRALGQSPSPNNVMKKKKHF